MRNAELHFIQGNKTDFILRSRCIFIYSTSNETQSLPKDPTSSHFDAGIRICILYYDELIDI